MNTEKIFEKEPRRVEEDSRTRRRHCVKFKPQGACTLGYVVDKLVNLWYGLCYSGKWKWNTHKNFVHRGRKRWVRAYFSSHHKSKMVPHRALLAVSTCSARDLHQGRFKTQYGEMRWRPMLWWVSFLLPCSSVEPTVTTVGTRRESTNMVVIDEDHEAKWFHLK